MEGLHAPVGTVRNIFAHRDLSESQRRRIELAVAVAQERLLATHVEHALSLARAVADRVPYGHAVAIYVRVLGLDEDDSRVVTTRALATLGEQEAAADWPEPPPRPEPEEEPGHRRTLFNVVRTRLRGRVDEELRQWVEFAVARAEVAILHTHVENALEFLDILDLPATETTQLYLDALAVRDGIAEVVYHSVLARLADRHLPSPKARPAATPPESPDEPRLRVVDRDGS